MDRQDETNPPGQPDASPKRPLDRATRNKLAFRLLVGKKPPEWTDRDDRTWYELKASALASRRLPPSVKEKSIRGQCIVQFNAATTNEERRKVLLNFTEQHFELKSGWEWFDERCKDLEIAMWLSNMPARAMTPAAAPAQATAAAASPRGFDELDKKNKHDYSNYFDNAALTARQRDCASMRFEYLLPVSEIARRLGLDRKTVQEHITAARRRLDRDQKWRQDAKRRAAHHGPQDE